MQLLEKMQRAMMMLTVAAATVELLSEVEHINISSTFDAQSH